MAVLGTRLRELRAAKGLSQQDVAVKAGLAVTTYTRFETGRPQPHRPGSITLATLAAIARALDCQLIYLIDAIEQDERDLAAADQSA